jgi:hypothetical protein
MTEVPEKDYYREMLKELSQLTSQAMFAAEHFVKKAWEIGKKITEYEERGWIERKKGDETIKKLASDLNIYWVTLYEYIQFARTFPSEKAVEALFGEIRKVKGGVSWNNVRKALRPRQKPEDVGGEDNYTDKTLSEVEHNLRYIEDNISKLKEIASKPEYTDEVQGVAEKAVELIGELSGAFRIPVYEAEDFADQSPPKLPFMPEVDNVNVDGKTLLNISGQRLTIDWEGRIVWMGSGNAQIQIYPKNFNR